MAEWETTPSRNHAAVKSVMRKAYGKIFQIHAITHIVPSYAECGFSTHIEFRLDVYTEVWFKERSTALKYRTLPRALAQANHIIETLYAPEKPLPGLRKEENTNDCV